MIDLETQRGRYFGRRVKPLDGDLRSRTLSNLYPSKDSAGMSILDGASSPASEDLPVMKGWLGSELDQMVEHGVSRALDLGGGDRLLQEYGRELAIGEFCRTCARACSATPASATTQRSTGKPARRSTSHEPARPRPL